MDSCILCSINKSCVMKKGVLSTLILLICSISLVEAQENIDNRLYEIFTKKEVQSMTKEKIADYNCFFMNGFYIAAASEIPQDAKIVNINSITEKKNVSQTVNVQREVDIKTFNPLLYNFEKYLNPMELSSEDKVYFTFGDTSDYGYLVFRPKTERRKYCEK